MCGLAAACVTVPISGRSQLSLVSDEAVARIADEHFSRLMTEVSHKVLRPEESTEAAQTIKTVARVSDRIIEAAGLRADRSWETVIIKDPGRINAFVLPNGKIVVYTGVLGVAQDEGGIAAVLGHEVGHVLARHTVEQRSQALLAQVAILTSQIAIAVAAKDARVVRPVGAIGGLAVHFGVMLPFSRTHELEADRLGMTLMAKAGYDPVGAVTFWERMAARGGPREPEFFATHPNPTTRRNDLQAWLPEATRLYAQSGRGAERVLAVAAPKPVASASAAPSAEPPPHEESPGAPERETRPPQAITPTVADLDVQLRSLYALLASQTITDTEHGLLRKRLIETWSFQGEPPAPGSTPGATMVHRAGRPWILGRWEGSHHGLHVSMDGSSFVFTQEKGQIIWYMRRRTTVRSWTGTLQASGTVQALTDLTVELRGNYEGSGWVGGKPLEYSLKRDGDQLDGVVVGADGLPFQVSLKRR